MNFAELAEERYSVRAFSDREVEPEKIEQLLRAAQVAPTAVNRQPFKLVLAQGSEATQAIRECTPYHFDAQSFIIVAADDAAGWVRKSDGRPYADIDASIVATHIMMQAHDLGLGTTWVGLLDAPLLKEKLPVLENLDIIAIFPLGYPAEDTHPNPRHFVRKELDELVIRL